MRLFVLCVFATVIAVPVLYAQTDASNINLNRISSDTAQISRTLEEMNKRLTTFSTTFTSNQGLRLSERQQRILFVFELLNRSESRLSNLQMVRVQMGERSVTAKRRLAQIEEELQQENVERSVTGSFNAEEARATRRRRLEEQRVEVEALLNEIDRSIRDYDIQIPDLVRTIEKLRFTIFPEIEKELVEFNK